MYIYKKYANPKGVKLDALRAASSPRRSPKLTLSGLCTLCVSREAAVHKCIAPRRRYYRLYIYRLSTNRTHGCPADTRVSHLRRSAPHRARPDATGGGRVRGREGATRPVARQATLSRYLRGSKGALTLRLHRPKGALKLRLHRLRVSRDKPPPRAGAEHKRARAPRKHARHNAKPPPTRQTSHYASAAARDTESKTARPLGRLYKTAIL